MVRGLNLPIDDSKMREIGNFEHCTTVLSKIVVLVLFGVIKLFIFYKRGGIFQNLFSVDLRKSIIFFSD